MRPILNVFSDRNWRDHLDSELVRKLEKLLKRVKAYEDAYRKSRKPSLAQLWVGLAEVFYQQERVNARLRKLEKRQQMLLDGADDSELDEEELWQSLENY